MAKQSKGLPPLAKVFLILLGILALAAACFGFYHFQLKRLRLGFDQPTYLFLLLIIPVLCIWSYRGLVGLGSFRRFVALFLRAIVITSIVFALAGVQMVWTDDRTTVMYVLDQSESIPLSKREAMLKYVVNNVKDQRNETREDRAGLIVFGKEASIEIPPFDDDIPDLRRLESYLGRKDATNLENALKMAQASMPDDTSRRVVIVTDGNENLGNATQLAARLAKAGIGIDVVPIELESKSEILVEKLDLPPNPRTSAPIDARVVISNHAADGGAGAPVEGTLIVSRKRGKSEEVLLNETMVLDSGKVNVTSIPHTIDSPGSYVYEAKFLPKDDNADGISQNNKATAYTHVRGKGRVLLIEDSANPGEYTQMIEALFTAEIEVDVMANNNLFTSLPELQGYDAVILAGVPRTSGDDESTISGFDNKHIEMLVTNTQQLGCGLLMIGGRDALGAGGWAGTKLEEAMPVNFRIRNTKAQAVGALAMIMHASEMAQGNYWQKVIARSALEALGPGDFCGVAYWGRGGDAWLWGGRTGLLPVGGSNRKVMLAALSRMTPGDMPYFDPAMKMTLAALNANRAAIKHCIIISDGDPSAPSNATISGFAQAGIKISTVAVASHGRIGSNQLRSIAQSTGGKYYEAKSPKALPKIFQREARRVSRPLVYEIPNGALPQVDFRHQILDGIDDELPPITGFVLTEIKDSPLAQVVLRSPMPEKQENQTVLAVWTYGLGRTAVLTTDVGKRWASSWTAWPGYDKFYSQLVRWLMRPAGDTGKFTMATKIDDGKVQVVVEALDKDDSFLNFLDMNAAATGPDLKPRALKMRQVAPGRYVGEFSAEESGSYLINVLPGSGERALSQGVTIPYSDEFRIRTANNSLMEKLASFTPEGGSEGLVTQPLSGASLNELSDHQSYRGGLALARSIRDAWHWFVLAGCCVFLGDVFIRRVSINFDWVGILLARMIGKRAEKEQQTTGRLAALKSKKDAINEERDRIRAATRFDPVLSDPTDNTAEEDATAPLSQQRSASPMSSQPEQEEKSYTERLLEAKRAARRKSDGE